MRLIFKQKISYFQKYEMYNEAGERLFTVKYALSLGQAYKFFDANGEELGMLVTRWWGRCKYDIFRGNKETGYSRIGQVKFYFNLVKSEFEIDYNGWQIEGDWFSCNFIIKDSNNVTVAGIHKELLNFTDTYVIDTKDNQDLFPVLAVAVIADLLNDNR